MPSKGQTRRYSCTRHVLCLPKPTRHVEPSTFNLLLLAVPLVLVLVRLFLLLLLPLVLVLLLVLHQGPSVSYSSYKSHSLEHSTPFSPSKPHKNNRSHRALERLPPMYSLSTRSSSRPHRELRATERKQTRRRRPPARSSRRRRRRRRHRPSQTLSTARRAPPTVRAWRSARGQTDREHAVVRRPLAVRTLGQPTGGGAEEAEPVWKWGREEEKRRRRRGGGEIEGRRVESRE